MVAFTYLFFSENILNSLKEKGWVARKKKSKIIIKNNKLEKASSIESYVGNIETGESYYICPENVDENQIKDAFEFLKTTGVYNKVEKLLDIKIKNTKVIFCYYWTDKICSYVDFKDKMSCSYFEFEEIIENFPDIRDIMKDFKNFKNKSDYSLQKICFN